MWPGAPHHYKYHKEQGWCLAVYASWLKARPEGQSFWAVQRLQRLLGYLFCPEDTKWSHPLRAAPGSECRMCDRNYLVGADTAGCHHIAHNRESIQALLPKTTSAQTKHKA